MGHHVLAKFLSDRQIELHPNAETPVCVYIDGTSFYVPIKSEIGKKFINLDYPIDFARTTNVAVSWEGQEKVTVCLDHMMDNQAFVEQYFSYHDDDLGVYVGAHRTFARVYAPLAKQVSFRFKTDKMFRTSKMTRNAVGVWELEIEESLHGVPYYFDATTTSGEVISFLDPYATVISRKGTAAIAHDNKKLHEKNTSKVVDATSAIIYRVCVNKFADGKYSNVVSKGSTRAGELGCLDYLKLLNVTHLEIADAVLSKAGFFQAINLSYCQNSDEIDAIMEFSTMVDKLLANNIGTILTIDLNASVAHHPFSRFINKHTVLGDSYDYSVRVCKNYLITSLTKLVKEFGISGFRLENSKLLDSDTIEELRTTLKRIKPSLIIYVDNEKCTTSAYKICSEFKDLIVGHGHSGYGLATGSIEGIMHAAKYYDSNSAIDKKLMFSIDTPTEGIYDRLRRTNSSEPDQVIINRARLSLGLLAFANGPIAFSSGKEVGIATENFNWDIINSRVNDVKFARELLALSKKLFVRDRITMSSQLNVESGIILVTIGGLKDIIGHDSAIIAYNVSTADYILNFNAEQIEIFNETGIVSFQKIYKAFKVPPLSFSIFVQAPTERMENKTTAGWTSTAMVYDVNSAGHEKVDAHNIKSPFQLAGQNNQPQQQDEQNNVEHKTEQPQSLEEMRFKKYGN